MYILKYIYIYLNFQNICSTSAYLESDSNNVAESESEETKNVYENSASVKTSRKNRFSNILPSKFKLNCLLCDLQ